MADLDVQPKKKSKSSLPWILLAIGVLALIIFLARGCNDDNAGNTGAFPRTGAGTTGNAVGITSSVYEPGPILG